MKLLLSAFALAALAATTYAKITTAGPGGELVGTWELKEKICERPGKKDLRLDYSSDRADTIAVLHFHSADRGMIEEIHLGKHHSCTGKSEFNIEYLPNDQMKLTQAEMVWDGQTSRDIASLGCAGDEGRSARVLDYSYDEQTDTLKLKQKDPSRVCGALISVFERK